MKEVVIPHTTKMVLFDLDNTLVETIKPKVAQHLYVARNMYNRELTQDQVLANWNLPFTALCKTLYGIDDSKLEHAIEAIDESYEQFPKEIYEGSIKLLHHLGHAGIALGILTSVSRGLLERDLPMTGLNTVTFDYTQAEGESDFHKPDPRVFQPAIAWMNQRGIKPGEAIYIGDALSDYAAAKGAGIEFIGVTTGQVTREAFTAAGASCLDSVADLRITPQ